MNTETGSNTEPVAGAEPGEWSVYIILCSDRSLYTGITTDPQRRFAEHASGKKGAKYFRGREPRGIVYLETGFTRSAASKREAEIKGLTHCQKLELINSKPHE
ncbi:MAG: GIY-YIG nuclease family protein [bacterium]